MLPILAESSPCVCGRPFQWRRLSHPEVGKGDSGRWLLCFGPGVAVSRWRSFVAMLKTQPPIVNFAEYGVLLITNEPPETQLTQSMYADFDCAQVRTLSDPEMAIGEHFRIRPVGVPARYPIAFVIVDRGEVVGGMT